LEGKLKKSQEQTWPLFTGVGLPALWNSC